MVMVAKKAEVGLRSAPAALTLEDTRQLLRRYHTMLKRVKVVADASRSAVNKARVLNVAVEVHLKAIDEIAQGLEPDRTAEF